MQKGKNFERELCNKLRHVFPFAERRLEYQESKCIGIDLDNTDRFKIQAKNKMKYVSINTIKEVISQKKTDVPVLITKANNEPAMAVLSFKEFVTLLEIAYGLRAPYKKADAKREAAIKEKVKTIFENTPSLSSAQGLTDLI